MNVEHDDPDLENVEHDPQTTVGHGDTVDRGFRKVMQVIRAANDERDIRALKSLRLEKLQGNRSHQHSLRINKKWRLIVEFRKKNGSKLVVVVGVEDYH